MSTEKSKENKTVQTQSVSKYDKQQLLKTARYKDRRDLLAALLKDDTQYSHAEVQKLIDEFMKGKVS